MKMDLHNVFEGRTVTIVGGGPSLLGYNFAPLKQPVIACNYAAMKVPNEMIVCIDERVTKKHGMGIFLDAYKGDKVCLKGATKREDFVKVEIHPNHETLDLDWHIAKVNLTGFLAIAVALHLGAKMIYLLGFDGGYDEGKKPVWYPEMENQDPSDYYDKNLYFDIFACNCIVNVGATSRIDSFPKVSLYTEFYKKDYHELLRNFTSR